MQGAWPFGLVEAVWSIVAVRWWWVAGRTMGWLLLAKIRTSASIFRTAFPVAIFHLSLRVLQVLQGKGMGIHTIVLAGSVATWQSIQIIWITTPSKTALQLQKFDKGNWLLYTKRVV